MKRGDTVSVILGHDKTRLKERNGVVTLTLPPCEGFTGRQWLRWFKVRNYFLEKDVEKFLSSQNYQLNAPGTVYTIKMISFDLLDSGSRNIGAMDKMAYRRGFGDANLEIICLLMKYYRKCDFNEIGTLSVILRHCPVEMLGEQSFIGLDCMSKYQMSYYTADPEHEFSGAQSFVYIKEVSHLV